MAGDRDYPIDELTMHAPVPFDQSTRALATPASADDAARPEAVDTPSPAIRRALVATDFAEPSQLAAGWVTRHLISDGELVLVHVVPRLDRPAFMRGSAPTIEELGETMRRGADVRLREMSRSLGVVHVWPEIRTGDAAHEILAMASDYAVDLIVVGESGSRTGARRLLGSTAERVLRDADVPVLLARNLTDAPPRHILVAIDDAAETSQLLAWTEMLALHFSAKVSALHVVSPTLSSAVQMVTAGVNPDRALHIRR